MAKKVAKKKKTKKKRNKRIGIVQKNRKYKTAQDMQKAVDNYFKSTDHPTFCGLGYFLGFRSRSSFQDYKKRYPKTSGFAEVIGGAKFRLEAALEERLYHNNAAGTIFNLKNNYGWKDQREEKRQYSGDPENPIKVVYVSNPDA